LAGQASGGNDRRVWSNSEIVIRRGKSEAQRYKNCSIAVSAITNATRAYPRLNVLIPIKKLDFNGLSLMMGISANSYKLYSLFHVVNTLLLIR